MVIVETNIPFIEETIAEIVNARLASTGDLDGLQRLLLDTTGCPWSSRCPTSGPAVVLVPLQVYRSVARVERLAFDIAARDIAAIITCARYGQLPDSLRQINDLVLRLPPMDVPLSRSLFEGSWAILPRLAGKPRGTRWVKHLLHTDFEHPRRMKLPRGKALEFIRSQVTERLNASTRARGRA